METEPGAAAATAPDALTMMLLCVCSCVGVIVATGSGPGETRVDRCGVQEALATELGPDIVRR